MDMLETLDTGLYLIWGYRAPWWYAPLSWGRRRQTNRHPEAKRNALVTQPMYSASPSSLRWASISRGL